LSSQELLQSFPQRSFWLVGDSGEQDPEAYGRVALACPERGVRIFIRKVEGANNTEERFKKAFEGLDSDSWTLFGDPAELQDRVIIAPGGGT
jgi:phosphatidate phosphatase APP1